MLLSEKGQAIIASQKGTGEDYVPLSPDKSAQSCKNSTNDLAGQAIE